METLRICLVSLHTLIALISLYSLHPHLSLHANQSNYHKQLSAIFGYVSAVACILLYHSASIVAVWFSRGHGSGMVRASGIMLIGVLINVIVSIIQHALDTDPVRTIEILINMGYVWVIVTALVLTFRLAYTVGLIERDRRRAHLLTAAMSELTLDGGPEFALV